MAKSRRAPESKSRRRPDDEEKAPRKKRKQEDEDGDDEGPIKPRKKRKSAAGPVRLVMRICAGVLGGIGLIFLLYWVYSPIGTDHALLCYFPPETTSLSGYDADEGMRNFKLKDVHDTLISNYKVSDGKRFNDSTGVVYTDVDKYMSGTAAGNYEEEKDLPLDSQDRRGSLTVIRFTKELDPEKFASSFSGRFKSTPTTSRDGKPYYQLQEFVDKTVGAVTQQEPKDTISFFFPNKRTLVYATTRRELEEALKRQPGRVVVSGDMRELANKVDGLYFQCSTGFNELSGPTNSMAFALTFVDTAVRDQKTYTGVTGTGSWFASNGNEFLYASATLYMDYATAKTVRSKLEESFGKARKEIYNGTSGQPSGLEDPFNPKDKAGGNTAATKDVLEALSEYSKHARVRRLGRLVIVEGTISHGMPEQGLFERFWTVVGTKYKSASQSNLLGGAGMGAAGPAGPPGPGAPGPIAPPGGARP
ncbi:MAG: hypothetical protein EXS09_11330 [Gemmataceae bacterium]|nr:hypothetical protein [Gemmataceae bacterium]